MTEACRCPACSSDKVYSLLGTLHCKRCKHIWKEEDDGGRYGSAEAVAPRALTIKVPDGEYRNPDGEAAE